MALALVGLPVIRHGASSPSCWSSGKQRMVILCFLLRVSSSSLLPAHGVVSQPGCSLADQCFSNSVRSEQSVIFESRSSVARRRISFWISWSVSVQSRMNSSFSMKCFVNASWSLRCMQTFLDSRSRGPISMRIGAPFLTHSHFLAPPAMSRLSTWTRSGSFRKSLCRRVVARASQASMIASRESSLGVTGIMITCCEATRGGQMRPSSSECAMMSVPMRRVETPHEVVQASCWVLSLPVNEMSCALEKF